MKRMRKNELVKHVQMLRNRHDSDEDLDDSDEDLDECLDETSTESVVQSIYANEKLGRNQVGSKDKAAGKRLAADQSVAPSNVPARSSASNTAKEKEKKMQKMPFSSYLVLYDTHKVQGKKGLLSNHGGDLVWKSIKNQGWGRLVAQVPCELGQNTNLQVKQIASMRKKPTKWRENATVIADFEDYEYEITLGDIAEFLAIANPVGEDVVFFAGEAQWPRYTAPNWPNETVAWGQVSQGGEGGKMKVKNLKQPYFVMEKIIRKSIYPKLGDAGKVTRVMLAILVCLKHNIKFNLPYLIYDNWINHWNKKQCCYGTFALRFLSYHAGDEKQMRAFLKKHKETPRTPYSVSWGHGSSSRAVDQDWERLVSSAGFPDDHPDEDLRYDFEAPVPREPSAAALRQKRIREEQRGGPSSSHPPPSQGSGYTFEDYYQHVPYPPYSGEHKAHLDAAMTSARSTFEYFETHHEHRKFDYQRLSAELGTLSHVELQKLQMDLISHQAYLTAVECYFNLRHIVDYQQAHNQLTGLMCATSAHLGIPPLFGQDVRQQHDEGDDHSETRNSPPDPPQHGGQEEHDSDDSPEESEGDDDDDDDDDDDPDVQIDDEEVRTQIDEVLADIVPAPIPQLPPRVPRSSHVPSTGRYGGKGHHATTCRAPVDPNVIPPKPKWKKPRNEDVMPQVNGEDAPSAEEVDAQGVDRHEDQLVPEEDASDGADRPGELA